MLILLKLRIIAGTATICCFSVVVILCWNERWNPIHGKQLLTLFKESGLLYAYTIAGLFFGLLYSATVYDCKKRKNMNKKQMGQKEKIGTKGRDEKGKEK